MGSVGCDGMDLEGLVAVLQEGMYQAVVSLAGPDIR